MKLDPSSLTALVTSRMRREKRKSTTSLFTYAKRTLWPLVSMRSFMLSVGLVVAVVVDILEISRTERIGLENYTSLRPSSPISISSTKHVRCNGK
jgi:hypothetical protein